MMHKYTDDTNAGYFVLFCFLVFLWLLWTLYAEAQPIITAVTIETSGGAKEVSAETQAVPPPPASPVSGVSYQSFQSIKLRLRLK